ncbi:MAG: ABC transporter permease [Nitriliruptoraceae bacterium]|nr:ABC transporter permease [Nitriliruptoraceae bacterium]
MLLGLREVLREPGRFVLIGGAVSLLIGLVVVFSGIGTRHVEDLNGAVARSSADLLVLAAGAEGAVQASRVDRADIELLNGLREVRDARPVGEARVGGLVDGVLYDVSLWGVGPGGPGVPLVVEGRAPARAGEAVIDVADAHLGLELGSIFEVADTGEPLTVVGLTEGRRFASIPTVVVTYAQWERTLDAVFADADGVEPALIAIELAAGHTPGEAIAAISDLDLPIVAEVPEVLAANLPGVAGTRASFASATLVALIAVSAVTGLFFLLGLTYRRKTYEVLRALGAPRWLLVRALVTQATLLVFGASLVGGGIVMIAAALAPPRVPLSFSAGLLGQVTVTSLLVTILSTLVAIRRLRRIDPAGALVADP